MTPTPMPLGAMPQDMQDHIAVLVASDTPPPKWISLGHAQIRSRAWFEWYSQRGLRPGRESIPPALRMYVIDRDGLVCQLCGGDVARTDVHIDHVLPVALGGSTVAANLQVAHSACNMRKGARV